MNFFINDILLCCYLLIICLTYSNQKSDYDLLFEWGKNNSVEISEKIYVEYINENNKTYYAKDKILKGEEILNIPNSIILNIESTLELYGKKSKKLYNIFKSEFKEKTDFYLEQAFIAFIMYKVNIKEKSKNKFYKYFQYYFNTFETNFDSYPIFYTSEQLNLIMQTSLGFLIDNMKKLYDEEISIFEKKCNQKKMNKEDYYIFRTYSSSKAFNISGHSVMIPFLDIFQRHPTKYNIEVIASDFDIKIIATRDILPNEKLFIKSDTLTNHNSLIYFGITFQEIIDRIEKYYIPLLNPFLIKNHNINLNEDSTLIKYFTEYIEIKKRKNDFYLKYLDSYKKLSNEFFYPKDNSELSAYKLIFENLLTLKEMNENIKTYIYKIFYTTKDINNILNIIKTENYILEQKIDLMKYIIDDMNINYKNNKKENDIEDINFDL